MNFELLKIWLKSHQCYQSQDVLSRIVSIANPSNLISKARVYYFKTTHKEKTYASSRENIRGHQLPRKLIFKLFILFIGGLLYSSQLSERYDIGNEDIFES